MEKDLCGKLYLADNERYADLINGLLLHGEQLVTPKDLQELDGQTFGGSRFKKKHAYRQLYRDLVKKVVFGMNFVVIGTENQSNVHYVMPQRCMAEDAAEYDGQLRRIGKKVRRMKGVSRAEYLSGFRKEDRLQPCITIVLYYGECWDGPRSLHELLNFQEIPPQLREYINDYPVHVFEIGKLENTEVFRTDLKQVFDFIRCSKDKDRLRDLVQKDEAFQNMEEDAYDMAVAYAGAEELLAVKKYRGKDGRINMCKGLADWIADERQQGIEQGIEQGMQAFVLDNLEEGVETWRIEEKLVKRFGLSGEDAKKFVEKIMNK